MPAAEMLETVAFPTELGWAALLASETAVKQIVFGYPSQAAALGALNTQGVAAPQPSKRWDWLVARLQQYATGAHVDFKDVPLDLEHLTPFQRRVIKHCRAIAYGRTRSYGELAAASGSERAARAVGNTMATNRFPLVVPCHRVVNSDGSTGQYSAPDGPRMKVRLLQLERGGDVAPARPARPTARKISASKKLARRPVRV